MFHGRHDTGLLQELFVLVGRGPVLQHLDGHGDLDVLTLGDPEALWNKRKTLMNLPLLFTRQSHERSTLMRMAAVYYFSETKQALLLYLVDCAESSRADNASSTKLGLLDQSQFSQVGLGVRGSHRLKQDNS